MFFQKKKNEGGGGGAYTRRHFNSPPLPRCGVSASAFAFAQSHLYFSPRGLGFLTK